MSLFVILLVFVVSLLHDPKITVFTNYSEFKSKPNIRKLKQNLPFLNYIVFQQDAIELIQNNHIYFVGPKNQRDLPNKDKSKSNELVCFLGFTYTAKS